MISLSWPRIRAILQKATTYNLKPTEESFPELPTVLIWFRFCLAVAYGTYVGSNLIRSAPYLLQALNVITFVPTMYCKFYLFVPTDVFAQQVIFAGLVHAMALCLLIWTYCYTLAHESSEEQLRLLLASAAVLTKGALSETTIEEEASLGMETTTTTTVMGEERAGDEEPEF